MFRAFSLCQSWWVNANLVAKIGGLFIHCLWSHLYYYFCRTNIATSKWSIAVPLSIGNISSLLIWLSTQSISKEIYWTKNKQKCITQLINMYRNFSSMLGLKKWLGFSKKNLTIHNLISVCKFSILGYLGLHMVAHQHCNCGTITGHYVQGDFNVSDQNFPLMVNLYCWNILF